MRSAPLVLIFLAIALLIDLYAYRLIFRYRKHKKPPKISKQVFWVLNLLAYAGVFGLNIYGYDLANPAARNFIIGGFGLLFFSKLAALPFLFLDDLLAFFHWC